MTKRPPHGCENSSRLDLFQMELWTSDQLQMCVQAISPDTRSAISSPESEDGALLCNLQDGPQIDPYGQEAAPVSHSQPQEKDSLKPMNDTCGQCSSISLRNADLNMSLGSRLQARLAKVGSMEYRQTWAKKVTPAGLPYWAHTASAVRISDKDCTGWPTPTTRDHKDGSNVTGVPANALLGRVCHLSGWATPNANNMNDGEGLETWDARQIKNKAKHRNGNGAGMPIAVQVKTITGWPTPMALDHWMASTERKDGGQKQLPNIAAVSGLTSSLSPAETGKPGAFQLNPHFSRYLMGFPPEWCDCAVTAMQSFPKLRRSSPKHI
jgi:hypothetical protein